MNPREQLISMLRLAHAIEIGAYQAYEGHWRSVKPLDNPIRGKIKFIQLDELEHRINIKEMLDRLKARRSYILDGIMWIIGRLVSYTCYVSPKFATAYGAKVMEIFAVAQYDTLAQVAKANGLYQMQAMLIAMQKKEEEHEAFFRSNR